MNTAERNLARADAFVAALAAAGLRHVAFGPGARSAPLAAAFLRRPEVACHVINDERAAGFFALGIGRATGRPAAVLTTSGTAAANLLPALMEANLAAVPLLALTADRPTEAVGWGANQTADQTRLYGDQVRAFHALPLPDEAIDTRSLNMLAARLVETSLAPVPGPVHANLPFREPLLPESIPAPPPLPAPLAIRAPVPAAPEHLDDIAARLSGRPGVILCGEAGYPADFAAAAARLAASLDAPIIAEPLSGLRHGPHDRSRILVHAARFLRDTSLPALPAPDWVLRFGAFPVSRTLERWLAGLHDAHHVLVAPPGRWPDPLKRSDTLLRGDPLAVAAALGALCRPAGTDFCRAWRDADAQAAVPHDPSFFEGTVARSLLAALPAGAHVFVGNSLAIRAVDAFGGQSDKTLALHGNRGASGIDGNLATAAGIAAATGNPTALLIGDQTLLHDCGSLALLAGRNVVILVLDNGGGGIFDHLPFAAALSPELLARGWTASPRVDIAALAAAFGLHHATAGNTGDLDAALETAFVQGGAWLLRAVIDRRASRAGFQSNFRQA
ncbi:MAG: 2-succinyl-5-enolpyruvyl-6-hydroxy-3-cyclohexene-1-carboxylic-acid synthase [Rhodocyclaceae bacterium]|jgi:2-succinyl-5-enolpyruvyl-6-hydroxy-3-cyclohexene-1-carboxylate synthase|nr:2-succinyl-5-enolpyruvyl-6-hydroxy-3-cyclohexene-1-carboxylic-acid synthase [Rhodocyclaceae bacterium]